MQVTQIYQIVNSVTSEILGKSDLVQEDLSNIVEVGTELFNANSVDNYVKALVDHIGKVIFVNRIYDGRAPQVLMDAWEFGSVLEKIQAEIPEATENETWELEDGKSYDPNIFYKPKVSVKFYNNLITFEIPCSITERQVKSSFSDATQLNSFLSMIYNAINTSMTIKVDALIMRTINNFIGDTVYTELGTTYEGVSGVRAVNLLHLYKELYPESDVTVENALSDKDFLRFALSKIYLYKNRLRTPSTLFNIGAKTRFTPLSALHIVLLDDFAVSNMIYLQSDTFHKELVELKGYESVPYWQASGKKYDFSDTSKINIKTSSGNSVEISGVLGVMFDRDALGVSNQNSRVTSNYNAKAEFWNQWYKWDARYFNDQNENFVVFYIADEPTPSPEE